MEVDVFTDIMSPDRLLSSILFIRPPGDNNTILVIEGGSDFKFYRNFVCDERYILQSNFLVDTHNGRKEKVIETVRKANEEGIKGIIGIVDADFDNLVCSGTEENLYRTDTHDLESMLLKSKKSLKKVLTRYSKVGCLISDDEISDIQNIIMESSKYVGYALWCSNHYNWRVNFKKFPIEKCIDDKCRMNIEELCKMLVIKSTNSELSTEDIELEISNKVSEQWDLWQVCRGKEMIRVLAHYIACSINNCKVRYDDLRDDLILAFDKDDFMKTSLYSYFVEWQKKHKSYSLINI